MMTEKQIQWFPGHMFKSLREIKEKIKLMDLVFVLLDARLPFSSMNPELHKIISHKPMLLLFNKMDLADDQIVVDNSVAKVSVVGAGMETHPGTASTMFEALYSADINIQMIATSEIKISVLVEEKDADKAVAAVHAAFFPEH